MPYRLKYLLTSESFWTGTFLDSGVNIVLEEDYRTYKQALAFLQIITLEDRRKELTLKFAEAGIVSGSLSDLFPRKHKAHCMETRKGDHIKETFANTKRLQNSPVLAMQRMLNQKHQIMNT